MRIDIQTPDFRASEQLLEFVTEKIGKLTRFSDQIFEAAVTLKVDKSTTRENKMCEIRLGIPGNDLFASRQCKSFEEATAKTVDALRSQIETRISRN